MPVGNNNRAVSKEALRSELRQHGTHELTKLLRVAGLPSPPQAVTFEDALAEEFRNDVMGDDDDDKGGMYEEEDPSSFQEDGGDGGFRRAHFRYRRRRQQKQQQKPVDRRTQYEKNRDRFTAGIQWQNYDKLLKQAEEENLASWATEDAFDKNPVARQKLIARILARIRLDKNDDPDDDNNSDNSISFAEQLIAFRRLSILLETNFNFLRLHQHGAFWESSCHFVLTAARGYNLGSTALRKRSLRQGGDTGYSFTVHPDNTVTIRVPIDFGDDELIQELDRNVWDFYDLMGGAGFEELFPVGFSKYEPDFVPYNALTARASWTTSD